MTGQRAVIGHLGHGGGGPEADGGLGPGAQVVPVALPPGCGVPAEQLSTNPGPRLPRVGSRGLQRDCENIADGSFAALIL